MRKCSLGHPQSYADQKRKKCSYCEAIANDSNSRAEIRAAFAAMRADSPLDRVPLADESQAVMTSPPSKEA